MGLSSNSRGKATLAYIAPFAGYVGLLQLDHLLRIAPEISYPLRYLVVLLLLATVSRPVIRLRPSFPAASFFVGLAVFLIWVSPDLLFHYRHHWLFENAIFGHAASSLPPHLEVLGWFTVSRALSSIALVPILEELFWRGWLMRWLIDADFQKVPLGKYAPLSFWMAAFLFASEHGPYWEVGLAAGIVYNWWMVRCRNLADCILAHAVTNAALAAYVMARGEWQYWL
ncbi:MAG TPA: CAAX prenyl protease-related protein [Bryobacteraceae bacterium]|nr:CAAX prenyl protease-related protein [Bryobacteraceae bacterium]